MKTSNKMSSFVEWMTSYGGASKEVTDIFYGLKFNTSDLISGLARLPFAFVKSIVFNDYLGVLFKVKILNTEVDCALPSIYRLIFEVIIFFYTCIFLLFSFAFIVKTIVKDQISNGHKELAILALMWVFAFFPFNMYWNNTDDQFWFLMLPGFWLFLSLPLVRYIFQSDCDKKRSNNYYFIFIIVFVLIIILNNLIFLILPSHKFDTRKLAIQLNQKIGDRIYDSVLIWPGSDSWGPVLYFAHEYLKQTNHQFRTISLISIATGHSENKIYKNTEPAQIVSVIKNYLSSGSRVFLLRITSQDNECVPWDNLQKIGWDRKSIMKYMIKNFTLTHFDYIESVELVECLEK